jgi:hypothetical protein
MKLDMRRPQEQGRKLRARDAQAQDGKIALQWNPSASPPNHTRRLKTAPAPPSLYRAALRSAFAHFTARPTTLTLFARAWFVSQRRLTNPAEPGLRAQSNGSLRVRQTVRGGLLLRALCGCGVVGHKGNVYMYLRRCSVPRYH